MQLSRPKPVSDSAYSIVEWIEAEAVLCVSLLNSKQGVKFKTNTKNKIKSRHWLLHT